MYVCVCFCSPYITKFTLLAVKLLGVRFLHCFRFCQCQVQRRPTTRHITWHVDVRLTSLTGPGVRRAGRSFLLHEQSIRRICTFRSAERRIFQLVRLCFWEFSRWATTATTWPLQATVKCEMRCLSDFLFCYASTRAFPSPSSTPLNDPTE